MIRPVDSLVQGKEQSATRRGTHSIESDNMRRSADEGAGDTLSACLDCAGDLFSFFLNPLPSFFSSSSYLLFGRFFKNGRLICVLVTVSRKRRGSQRRVGLRARRCIVSAHAPLNIKK